MALSCLLLEAYEAFRQGWRSSDGKSKKAFGYFFDREDLFLEFKTYAEEFWKNIRCGILHQGETTGGWHITRENREPLFDSSTRTVHATKFHALIADVIDKSRTDLKTSLLTTGIWKCFTTKMESTIDHCKP